MGGKAARVPAATRPVCFPCEETCPEKLTYRGFLCQNEKIRGRKYYFLRHSARPASDGGHDRPFRLLTQLFEAAYNSRESTFGTLTMHRSVRVQCVMTVPGTPLNDVTKFDWTFRTSDRTLWPYLAGLESAGKRRVPQITTCRSSSGSSSSRETS